MGNFTTNSLEWTEMISRCKLSNSIVLDYFSESQARDRKLRLLRKGAHATGVSWIPGLLVFQTATETQIAIGYIILNGKLLIQ